MGHSKESSLESLPPYTENGDALRPPITLILDNQTIHLGSDSSTPLYHLSQSITALQTQDEPSSVRFDSVSQHEKAESTGGSTTTNLFHLVHPINARYRSDTPGYYATGNPSSTASNFLLQPSTSKNPLHKPEFTVLASPGRTAASADLFADPKDQQTLLTAKQKWTSGRYVWRSGEGKEIAIEEGEKNGEGPRRKMIINEALEKETMDALVAAWCLRCWYDVAESKEMTKRRLDAMTPPESISGVAMKWPKRTGAMAGLGAGGGGM